MAIYWPTPAWKGERLSSVFSPDGTWISASAAPHCGGGGETERGERQRVRESEEEEREREKARERGFFLFVCLFFCFLPSTSLWGVYSNSMHPSIITMYTFTPSFTFLYIIHFHVSPNEDTEETDVFYEILWRVLCWFLYEIFDGELWFETKRLVV